MVLCWCHGIMGSCWCHGALLVSWCHDGVIVSCWFHMSCWCHSVMLVYCWCHEWCPGWCHSVILVSWCYCVMVSWWYAGFMIVSWCPVGVRVLYWCHGFMLLSLLSWFNGVMLVSLWYHGVVPLWHVGYTKCPLRCFKCCIELTLLEYRRVFASADWSTIRWSMFHWLRCKEHSVYSHYSV
jgi:hypothetical protein